MAICTVCGRCHQTEYSRLHVCPTCQQETKPCECGCGTLIPKWKTYRLAEERRFVRGHNRAGILRGPMKDAVKMKISIAKDGWPPERLRALRENYATATKEELRVLFPDKSMRAIYVKAFHEGLSKSVEILDRNYAQLSKERQGSNNPAWNGGRWAYSGHHYGADWHRQRRSAKRRDNFTCQDCGKQFHKKSPHLHVHHIRPFRLFNFVPGQNENYREANLLDNLISLCETCHLLVEASAAPD